MCQLRLHLTVDHQQQWFVYIRTLLCPEILLCPMLPLDSEDTDLETMSIEHLHDYVDGLENNVHFLSEELVKELAFRDELNYEKETKNRLIAAASLNNHSNCYNMEGRICRFLCLLMTVQKKKKEVINDSSSSSNLPARGAMKTYELAFKKLRNFSDRVIQKRSVSIMLPFSIEFCK